MEYVEINNFKKAFANFKGRLPFDHCVVDDFFKPGVAEILEAEFLEYENPKWFYYKNAIEDKKALNDWNQFPINTYKVFCELMSPEFVKILEEGMGARIYVDHGLHGGGWHMHGTGGNLNPHLDYSIHPKMSKLRKLNIIMYLSKDLKEEHGGHLGLYDHDPDKNEPGALRNEIQPKFNRAAMFDTTQNSWHGMSRPLTQPEGIYRKSLAIYYLTDITTGVDSRQRALFAPRDEQKNNNEITELIRIRSDSKRFSEVYRK